MRRATRIGHRFTAAINHTLFGKPAQRLRQDQVKAAKRINLSETEFWRYNRSGLTNLITMPRLAKQMTQSLNAGDAKTAVEIARAFPQAAHYYDERFGGESPLLTAQKLGQHKAVQAFINAGANPSAVGDDQGNSCSYLMSCQIS